MLDAFSVSTPIPHAVSWNLTERCNLHFAHCDLNAEQRASAQAGELSGEECARVVVELIHVRRTRPARMPVSAVPSFTTCLPFKKT